MWKWLFGSRKEPVYCCYGNHRFEVESLVPPVRCENCERDFPQAYVEERTARPLFCPMVGWTTAGKTCWLYATMLLMENFAMLFRNERTFVRPTSPDAEEGRRLANESLGNGKAPKGTTPGADELTHHYLLTLRKLPRWSDRTLVLRDVPGEYFDGPQKDSAAAKAYFAYLSQMTTFMFVLSLANSFADNKTPNDLLTLILNGIPEDSKGQRTLRHIIVVITQADSLIPGAIINRSRLDLPPNLFEYVNDDPAALQETRSGAYSDIHQYIASMQAVSDDLRRWIETLSGGTNMVRLAEKKGIVLKFCAISALGGKTRPGSQELFDRWRPLRVLDPIFWALELESEPVPKK